LQYQIKRCSAPCVNKIAQEDYAALVDQAHEFLSGRSHQMQEMLGQKMQEASDVLDFERAAQIRDRIRALTQVQAHQDINVSGIDDADVIAAFQDSGQCCIQVFFFRGGRNYGNRAYFPSHDRNAETDEILTAFLGQFYERSLAPKLVFVSHALKEQSLVAEALSLRADHKVRVVAPRRGARRNLVDHALSNARDALGRRLAESASQRRLLEGLAEKLGLDTLPDRIEIYDNSHIQGENAVGGMVVSGPEGFVKNAYRKFNIRSDEAAKSRSEHSRGGDDYEMMREVLTRRFSRALKEDPDRGGGQWPDLIILDGGKGQLSVAEAVFADLGIDDVGLLAVSKGPDRNAGREQFHMPGRQSFILPSRDPVLHYLQRLRDEAHRFAIGSHRARRSRAITASPLDGIAGIGAKRKKALLMRFGSAKAVAEAGLADLEAVDSISSAVAQKIYGHFHGEG
jgi:excinuclease ABC subunit C